MNRLVLALALLVGCKSSDPMDRLMDMMGEYGDAIEAANGDCQKMADGAAAVFDKYKDDWDAMKAVTAKAKQDTQKAADEQMRRYGDRVPKLMRQMALAEKCSRDPKFQAVSARLGDVF